jgi:hypothetical protein
MGFGTPPTVLEGNYSTYTYQWKYAIPNFQRGYGYILRVDETNDFIQFNAHEERYITKLVLSTGALISETNALQIFTAGVANRSLLQKYVAYVMNDGDVPKLKIEKDGSLLITIDLSLAPISWSSVSYGYHVSVSPDGKFILVYNHDVLEYALFKGS